MEWKEALMCEGSVDVSGIGSKRKAVRLTLSFVNYESLTVACRSKWASMKPKFAARMKLECWER